MKHLTALVAIRVWWAGPADGIVLVALVCGFAGLVCLALRHRAPMPPVRGEQEPDKRDVQSDIPPSPG
jgi:hypothetical protein